ncbi:MAG: prepilin-type N-terminal cleavage/methylation domain-containing protein [Gammaproteobacteria bacterium]|mgnify:CR=1 FL=1|nr:MAG: prepilin-type N-terminal cleavage/methylation domain-containing protein [Gammaproteobacteria bacterium]
MEKIKQQQGVTFIELLVSLAVVAILISVAAPAFQQMVVNNRVESTAELLRNSILHARNTSIQNKSAHSVRLNGDASAITGWVVGATGDFTSRLIVEAVNEQIELKEYSGAAANIDYNSYGYIAGSEDLVKRVFTVCHKDGESGLMGKAVILSSSGMVMIKNANQSIEDPANPANTIDICQ